MTSRRAFLLLASCAEQLVIASRTEPQSQGGLSKNNCGDNLAPFAAENADSSRTTDEDDHYPFELEKITLWFYFTRLDPRISSTEMKAARKRTNKLSRLLEAALDTALLIVLGYGLILLSHSQAPF